MCHHDSVSKHTKCLVGCFGCFRRVCGAVRHSRGGKRASMVVSKPFLVIFPAMIVLWSVTPPNKYSRVELSGARAV